MKNLTKNDKTIIKFCKGLLKEKYPFKERWHESLVPVMKDLGYYDQNQFLNVTFNVLFDIFDKIYKNEDDYGLHIKEIFSYAFFYQLSLESYLPIEKGITKLCQLIQQAPLYNWRGDPLIELF